MSGWNGQGNPLVSVICITYNHEGFIAEAIDGFLRQETDFPIEIIIHDDASTDGTPGIIKEYAEQYPLLIKPIFQTTNQYSQGKKCFFAASSYATGDYIAICEADDYWTDSDKLKIQIGKMTEHPDCHISFHPAWKLCCDVSRPAVTICAHSSSDMIFSPAQVIVNDGSFMPSASLCLKREFMEYMFTNEDFFLKYSNDYIIQLFGSLNGGALYINKCMSVYRYRSKGSWTQKVSEDGNFLLLNICRSVEAINAANILLQRTFSKEFDSAKNLRYRNVLRSRILSVQVKTDYFRSWCKDLSMVNKVMWVVLYKYNSLNRLAAFMVLLFRQMREFGIFYFLKKAFSRFLSTVAKI